MRSICNVRPHRDAEQAVPTSRARALRQLRSCALLAALMAPACATQVGTEPDDQFVVTSEPATGVLARIDYDEGSSVLFLREDEGVSVASLFETGTRDPLAGIDTTQLAPSDVFRALTQREVPAVLDEAERAAGLVSSPEALAALENVDDAPRDLGQTTQALTAEAFRSEFCDEHPQCATDVHGNLILSDSLRYRSAVAVVDVVEGTVRVRIQRDRALGSWDTSGSAVDVPAGRTMKVTRHIVATFGRHMRVKLDAEETAHYHAAARFVE